MLTRRRIDILMLVICFGLAFLIILNWYHGAALIYFWDGTIPIDVGRGINEISHILRYDFWPGKIDPSAVAMLPYFGALWLLSFGGSALMLGQRLLFAALLVAPAIGMYQLTGLVLEQLKMEGRTRTCSQVVAAFGYACNPFVITNLWRIFSTHTFAYAVHPFLAYVGLRYLTRPRPIYLVYAAILMILASPGYSNIASYAAVVLTLALPVLFAFTSPDGKTTQSVLTIRALRFAFVLGVFSLWFLAPQLMNVGYLLSNGSYGGTHSALIQNSAHASIYNNLRLIGGPVSFETFNGEPDYRWIIHYNAPPYVEWLATNLYVVLAIGGLYAAIRRRALWYATTGFALSLLLSCGPRAPITGPAFKFLFDRFSVAAAFRDPFDKFGLSLTFWEFIFVALGTFLALQHLKNRDEAHWSRGIRARLPIDIVGATFAALTFAVAGWPLLTGGVQRFSNSLPGSVITFPMGYENIRHAVINHWPAIVLPLSHGPLTSENWQHGYVGFDPLRFSTYAPILSTVPDDRVLEELLSATQDKLTSVNGAEQAKDVIRSLGFRTIVVLRDQNPLFSTQAKSASHIIVALRRTGTPALPPTSTGVVFQIDNKPAHEPSLGLVSLTSIAQSDTALPWMYRITPDGLIDRLQYGPRMSTWHESELRLISGTQASTKALLDLDDGAAAINIFNADGSPEHAAVTHLNGALRLVRSVRPRSVRTLAIRDFHDSGEIPNDGRSGHATLRWSADSLRVSSGETSRPYAAHLLVAPMWLRYIAVELTAERPATSDGRAALTLSLSNGSTETAECALANDVVTLKQRIAVFCAIAKGTRAVSIFLSVLGNDQTSEIIYSNPKLYLYDADPRFFALCRTPTRKGLPISISVARQTSQAIDASLGPGGASMVTLENTCFDCGWRLATTSDARVPDGRFNYHAPAWFIPRHGAKLQLHFINVAERAFVAVETLCTLLMLITFGGLLVLAFQAQRTNASAKDQRTVANAPDVF